MFSRPTEGSEILEILSVFQAGSLCQHFGSFSFNFSPTFKLTLRLSHKDCIVNSEQKFLFKELHFCNVS